MTEKSYNPPQDWDYRRPVCLPGQTSQSQNQSFGSIIADSTSDGSVNDYPCPQVSRRLYAVRFDCQQRALLTQTSWYWLLLTKLKWTNCGLQIQCLSWIQHSDYSLKWQTHFLPAACLYFTDKQFITTFIKWWCDDTNCMSIWSS